MPFSKIKPAQFIINYASPTEFSITVPCLPKDKRKRRRIKRRMRQASQEYMKFLKEGVEIHGSW